MVQQTPSKDFQKGKGVFTMRRQAPRKGLIEIVIEPPLMISTGKKKKQQQQQQQNEE